MEREERGPEGMWRKRTGAKCYVETGGDLMGKVHTPSQFMNRLQMGTGKWQNGRELYRQAMPGQAPEQGH